ncbi:hypothetical protein N0V83_009578 [Neocucurbitaria cava]|uniref:Uncharacterized protein n=1 Tax=Neocucurbitaria cava TaxID=798079 RepID=A0A9W8Y2Y8_9PLEO|nr:hypothetical protein N0V83_009578 [Neocucurbitaria cava]
MVTTRSKTTQTHLEDYAATKSTSPKSKHQPKTAKVKASPPKANTSRKRKSSETTTPPTEEKKPTPKRTKSTAPAPAPASKNQAEEPEDGSEQEDEEDENVIIINRAPVLHLWSACVRHVLYPDLPWPTCLSAGAAISAICAVAKGRSIGTIPEKEKDVDSSSSKEKKKRQDAKEQKDDLESIDVMQFHLRLKDGLALVSSADKKGKPGNEDVLRKKFGGEGEGEYERVKGCFEEVLGKWEGEEELGKRAFGLYEGFRPDVRAGQKGWGGRGVEVGAGEERGWKWRVEREGVGWVGMEGGVEWRGMGREDVWC